jgi:hypothetical protein
MRSESLGLLLVLALISNCGFSEASPSANQDHWSWQDSYAAVDPKGDLTWAPRPFVFQKSDPVRYIDFEGGSDANPGDAPARPWKHHPWDPNATANAASASGIRTFIFKRGATYRGTLRVKEPGVSGAPVRLTSDPSWGKGEAVLCGSERVLSWKRGATHPDIPEPQLVWWADLDFAPRCVWSVSQDGKILRLPLARVPKWKVSNPDDVKSEWWVWDNPGKPFGNTIKDARGTEMHLGIDTQHIKDKPASYFKGAIIWPEYGWVMSAPYPTEVEVVDLEHHGLGFGGWTGGGTGDVVMRNMRYYLEDKPQYLDDSEGEYWFEKKGAGGRLYLRPPGDADPNTMQIEAGRRMNLIDGEKVEHLEITGLTFRFTQPEWDITSAPWNFNTEPWTFRPEAFPGAVRVWGEGKDIRIANCLFEHVFFPIRIRSILAGQRVDDVRIEDNDFRFTDDGILSVSDGSAWGYAQLRGRLGDVRIYRNHSLETGRRPARYNTGTGMEVSGARTLEIAGNIIERSYGQGIDVHGSKVNGCWGDVPFTRLLIHHNKVWESMLNCNDYGGIETWQGGPFYVFDNISYNALGYQNWARYSHDSAGFGHAYYLDGAFKNYHFNNIAWGKAKDVESPVVNCSAFQEIISYQNTFFNNTVYNYYTGSRRQEPEAGRNKYLANIWCGIGQFVLRHADPAKTAAEGEAQAARPSRKRFDLASDAYGGNVFYDFAEMGVLEPSGRWLHSFDDFKATLVANDALLTDLGVVARQPPLRDPAHGDFRPAPDVTPDESRSTKHVFRFPFHGAKVFVPWSLFGVVGEWNFCRPGDDPTHLMDEHWYMADYFVSRDTYRDRPMYALKGVHITAADYTNGPLQDWTAGALNFSAARKQYAVLANAEIMKPFSFRDLKKSQHERAQPEDCTVEGAALKNPQIYTGNLLIEVHFKAAPECTGGVLIEKLQGAGYSLTLSSAGRIRFSVQGPGASAAVESRARVSDGKWHHVIAELDRAIPQLTIYLDGRKDVGARGIAASVSLANDGDLYVAGTPTGRWFDGTLDFLRLAQGTLADAQTTIEELYAWEFDGPFLRDFAGVKPTSAQRTAGAIQAPLGN